MLRKTLKISVTGVAALVMATFGLGGLASATSISNTGPGSTNKIIFSGHSWNSYKNNNNVGVNSSTNQNAHTGNATVGVGSWGSGYQYGGCGQMHEWQNNPCGSCNSCNTWSRVWSPCGVPNHGGGNTNGGNATSGDAENDANTGVDVEISNKTPHGTKSHSSNWGGNASIENTGPHSENIIKLGGGNSSYKVTNDNDVDVTNKTKQNASSGNATVSGNTNGGNASTGNANNEANTETEVEIVNASAPAWNGGSNGGNASIDTTGPHSSNVIQYGGGGSKVSVSNNNNVSVSSSTTQNASSGNATVSGNTNGGNATTGNASNSSNTTTSVSISN